MAKRGEGDGGQGAWLAKAHAIPAVQHSDEVYQDLVRLQDHLGDDPYVREHFTTLVHRLYSLALKPYQDATPV